MKTYQYEIEDVGSTPSEDREYLNHAGALGFRLVCVDGGRMYLERSGSVAAFAEVKDDGNT